MKFYIKDSFSKCDQILRKMRIWSHFLKNFLMENFTFLGSGRCLLIRTQTLFTLFCSRSYTLLNTELIVFLQRQVLQFHSWFHDLYEILSHTRLLIPKTVIKCKRHIKETHKENTISKNMAVKGAPESYFIYFQIFTKKTFIKKSVQSSGNEGV